MKRVKYVGIIGIYLHDQLEKYCAEMRTDCGKHLEWDFASITFVKPEANSNYYYGSLTCTESGLCPRDITFIKQAPE